MNYLASFLVFQSSWRGRESWLVCLVWLWYFLIILTYFPMISHRLFVCLFCCFTSQVNSYGHCGTVSSPNHTFSWAGLNKRFNDRMNQRKEENDRRNHFMINLHESIGPDRDRTRDPWICRQTRICSQTHYRLRYVSHRKWSESLMGVHANLYLVGDIGSFGIYMYNLYHYSCCCNLIMFWVSFFDFCQLTLKAPRIKCIWKCRLLKSSAANNCITLLTN